MAHSEREVRAIGLGRRFKKGDAKPAIRPLPSLGELHRLFSYDPEMGVLAWKANPRYSNKPCGSLGTVNNKGYLVVGISRTYYLAHRIIWKMVTGCDPVAFVDHRDGNKLNNRWGNLRTVTNGENIQNSKLRCDNSSGVKGVHWDKSHKRWAATIAAGNGQVKLGRFESKDDAIAARVSAERKMHGEFARHSHKEYVS